MTDYLYRCRACELRLCDRCTLHAYLTDRLSCWTQEQIAEAVGCDQKTVTNVISGETADLPEFLKSHPASLHQVDFEIPIYNVWQNENKEQGKRTDLTSAQRSAEVSDSSPTRAEATRKFNVSQRGCIAKLWQNENKEQGKRTDLTSPLRSGEVPDPHPTTTEATRKFNVSQAAEIKLRAERRAGEMLKEQIPHEGGRPEKPSHDVIVSSPTLSELGITPMQSSRWQLEASIPEAKFEACHTEQEIADKVDISRDLVHDRIPELCKTFPGTKSTKLSNFEEVNL